MKTTSPASVREQLLDRRLDLAFASLPAEVPDGIVLDELAHSVMDLVARNDHPLAARKEVPISDLAGLDFIDSPVSYGNRRGEGVDRGGARDLHAR